MNVAREREYRDEEVNKPARAATLADRVHRLEAHLEDIEKQLSHRAEMAERHDSRLQRVERETGVLEPHEAPY